jgi:hypothetical protein
VVPGRPDDILNAHVRAHATRLHTGARTCLLPRVEPRRAQHSTPRSFRLRQRRARQP